MYTDKQAHEICQCTHPLPNSLPRGESSRTNTHSDYTNLHYLMDNKNNSILLKVLQSSHSPKIKWNLLKLMEILRSVFGIKLGIGLVKTTTGGGDWDG